MNIMLLLEMAAESAEDRVAIGRRDDGLSYRRLFDLAAGAANVIEQSGSSRVAYTAESSPVLPAAMFGASWAGVPFVPVNYRLADDRIRSLIARQSPALVVVDEGTEFRFADIEGIEVVTTEDFLARCESAGPREPGWQQDPDDVAVLLHTSGTSGEPKAAVLRQRHLSSYVLGSVEFMGAGDEEATLASVPPYHIAAVSGTLTAVYSGRRLVQLPSFDAYRWVQVARAEKITHAMTVPTMLARILDVIDPSIGGDGLGLPTITHLSYGGGRMPVPVIERALALLPDVDFVNAYGLTETSSSIAILTPEDHRVALASDQPHVHRRLGSVGRPLHTVEISVRDEAGNGVAAGRVGEIWVRGDQVSGEYLHHAGGKSDGWFQTNDGGWLDDDGYLFVDGRLDDVIVRGGENLSPGEIEDVLIEHASVREAAVVGVPDTEWGEVVAAVVVAHEAANVTPEELADFVVSRLRSTRRPAIVELRNELPMNDNGKILRRVLRDELTAMNVVASH